MIEFDEKSHVYLKDGIIVPGVTTILAKTIFKDKYKDIPEYILKKAAQFGTNVHKAIELDLDIFLNDEESTVFNRYKRLIKKHDIKPMEQEIIVYTDDYIGTLDMNGMVKDEFCLLDIKTTYHLDRDYLSWQLTFYALAYEHMYNKKFDKLYAIWLPKRKGAELVEIERKSKEEIMELVRSYYELYSV